VGLRVVGSLVGATLFLPHLLQLLARGAAAGEGVV
jgi:hypothetical protein